MRRRRAGLFLIAAAVVVLATALPSAPGAAQTLRDLLPFGRTHRIAKLLQVVVNISIHKLAAGTTDGAAPRRIEAFGSGFIIDPSGLVVTNRHVIDNALDITVVLSDGTALPAKLRGTGRTIDIALLEVTPPKPLPVVVWGDSDKVRVGDQVLAVGNPFGIGESVSAGIVSAKNRDILTTPFDDYIQTDAAINHGNSGGPLFNTRGDVIGMNTALYSPTAQGGSLGIGFAIPGNDARTAADQLRRLGHLEQGWLGLRTQDVTANIADALDLPETAGTIVVGVEPDSPAARAGVQVGDVILKYGKQAPKDARALARMISATPIGQPAALQIWRDRKEQTITAQIAVWPDEQPVAGDAAPKSARPTHVDLPDLGLQTASVSDETRAKFKLANSQTGIVITGVTPGSAADEGGLGPGLVILRVQQAPVTTPADLLARLSEARAAKHHYVLLLVQDHDDLRWVPLVVG
ncbi:MAG TPA: trypsin-like peptidase domain-containing protein [Acetobacteraceae bacterium]|nr:trypsin-like peptidase domain-containing protein [Acetobacteraceae bacterium]